MLPGYMASLPLLLVLLASLNAATATQDYSGWWKNTSADDDFVPWVPVAGNLTFPLYAGYVVVNDTAGRALYYIFTPAKTNSKTAPLLLWLNGGPGCSSVASGYAEEHGPFYPDGNNGLITNPDAWHNFASVLYVDSPAFVGFSYSLTRKDAVTNDTKTVADLHTFLVNWFKKFPEYAANDFYITGESYAGRFIPLTSMAIMEGNKHAPKPERINLKGMAIGNGVTDVYWEQKGMYDYYYHLSIISDEAYKGLKASCKLGSYDPRTGYPVTINNSTNGKRNCPAGNTNCCAYWYTISGIWRNFPGRKTEAGQIINYDFQIFTEWPCPANMSVSAASSSPGLSNPHRQLLGGQRQMLAQHSPLGGLMMGGMKATADIQAKRRALLATKGSEPYTFNNKLPVECMDPNVMDYFARKDVQKAYHANPSGVMTYPFLPCAFRALGAPLNHEYGRDSMLPAYRKLIKKGIKVLTYSGDADACITTTGTRYAMAALKLNITTPWAPWYSCTGNVGGRVVQYQGLDMYTIRNAGHETPWYEGERTSWVFRQWLGVTNNCSTVCKDCTTPW